MRACVAAIVGTAAFATSLPTLAQDQDIELEEVQVTGSRIRRANDFDTANPTTVVDSDYFRNLGIVNVGDAIKSLPSNVSNNSPATTGNANFFAGSTIANLRGLTLLEAEKVLTKAIVEDARLSHDDIEHVIAAKKDIVEREGVLEYYPVDESMESIADLAGLKAWLAKRTHIIAAPEKAASFGLTFPKGVLLIGVPGCGSDS